jgi:hypothetical protein
VDAIVHKPLKQSSLQGEEKLRFGIFWHVVTRSYARGHSVVTHLQSVTPEVTDRPCPHQSTGPPLAESTP